MKEIRKDIIDTPFLFKQWCKKLKPVYSFDTETNDSVNWLTVQMVGFSIFDGRQACYTVVGFNQDGIYTPSKHKKDILDILEFTLSEAELVIGHNIVFDIMVLEKEGIKL